jgi:hypothetical protein
MSKISRSEINISISKLCKALALVIFWNLFSNSEISNSQNLEIARSLY